LEKIIDLTIDGVTFISDDFCGQVLFSNNLNTDSLMNKNSVGKLFMEFFDFNIYEMVFILTYKNNFQ